MRVSESFVATCGPPPSPPFGISGPKQSAASRGEIKRNVRFDGGSDDARPNGRRRGGREGGKIPRAMSEMRLRAMPCHPYLMAQFMVQDGSGRQGADRAPHNIKCERSLSISSTTTLPKSMCAVVGTSSHCTSSLGHSSSELPGPANVSVAHHPLSVGIFHVSHKRGKRRKRRRRSREIRKVSNIRVR